jgi:hypothetical protein
MNATGPTYTYPRGMPYLPEYRSVNERHAGRPNRIENECEYWP